LHRDRRGRDRTPLKVHPLRAQQTVQELGIRKFGRYPPVTAQHLPGAEGHRFGYANSQGLIVKKYRISTTALSTLAFGLLACACTSALGQVASPHHGAEKSHEVADDLYSVAFYTADGRMLVQSYNLQTTGDVPASSNESGPSAGRLPGTGIVLTPRPNDVLQVNATMNVPVNTNGAFVQSQGVDHVELQQAVRLPIGKMATLYVAGYKVVIGRTPVSIVNRIEGNPN